VEARRAVVIRVADADAAFSDLAEKTRALAEMERPHPLTTAAAVGATKLYAPDPQARVRLGELFDQEAREVLRRVQSMPDPPPTDNSQITKDFVRRQMESASSACDTLIHMAAALAYHGTSDQSSILVRCIERLAGSRAVHEEWTRVRLYPALLLTYASGLAAMAGERTDTLARVLLNPRIRLYSDGPREPPWAEFARVWQYDASWFSPAAAATNEYRFPLMSFRLQERLKDVTVSYLSVPEDFEDLFWLFEFHFELACIQTLGTVPSCMGVANHDFDLPESQVRYRLSPAIAELVAAAEAKDPGLPILKAGFFAGSGSELLEAIAKLKAHTKECRKRHI
jgi:hypothetical protein